MIFTVNLLHILSNPVCQKHCGCNIIDRWINFVAPNIIQFRIVGIESDKIEKQLVKVTKWIMIMS